MFHSKKIERQIADLEKQIESEQLAVNELEGKIQKEFEMAGMQARLTGDVIAKYETFMNKTKPMALAKIQALENMLTFLRNEHAKQLELEQTQFSTLQALIKKYDSMVQTMNEKACKYLNELRDDRKKLDGIYHRIYITAKKTKVSCEDLNFIHNSNLNLANTIEGGFPTGMDGTNLTFSNLEPFLNE